ncbi:MAG: transposase [Phycisphaerae bacterium]
MPQYRRIEAHGATIFFTLVTLDRRPILTSQPALDLLRAAFREERRRSAFWLDAIVVLPDHLHCIWTLPRGDSNFSIRWSRIKTHFTTRYLRSGGDEARRSASRQTRGERGVWQRRFWDHVIRDDDDFGHHLDYVHFNPVKRGYANCPHAWAPSSFRTWVRKSVYPVDWLCACRRTRIAPDFSAIEKRVGE